ncbi:hypothetical protein FRB93_009266 [Tulasnella sp. JGI-2019a]|nr:hypothetical protein FRB93_009266 [Tulasnella sp. JGI-2019a]
MKLEEASFAAAAKNATGGGQMNNGLGGNNNGMGYNGMNVLSAGGKERAINELKDFWSAFISEPLTGGTPGAGGLAAHMLMRQRSTPSLKTPMPLSSERSSILGGGFNENGSPTPRGLYPNGGTSSALGLFGGGGVGGSSLNPNNQRRSSAAVEKATNAATEQPQQQQQQPQRIGGGSTDDEASLRSYQEACLKRDPPMLRLVARPKSRAPTGSTATSPQAQVGGGNRSSSSPHGTAVPPLPMSTSPPPQLESKDSNDSNSSKTSNTTLRGVQTLGSFATPYAPDSKQEREWLSQFQHNRGGAVNNDAAMMMGGGGVTAGLGSHSRSVSLADPITMSSAMSTGVTSRPAYKRLPSQTLGPEHSKKQAMNSSYTEGDWTNVDGSNEASDPYHDGRGPFRMMVATSTTQPGYGVNSASGISGGGAQGAWQRQRSMSSPTTMRTFDWQTTGAAAGGR